MRWLVPVTLLAPVLGLWTLVEPGQCSAVADIRLGTALAILLGSAVVVASEVKVAARLTEKDHELKVRQDSTQTTVGNLTRALRQRSRIQQDLERSNRDLDDFAHAASHDLRAPLRGIANLARFLEEDLGTDLPSASRKQLGLLCQRVHRMEALIEGILKYSRAGYTHEPPMKVAIDELLRETIELLAPPSGSHIKVAPGMPELVTERAQIQQVFLNLISNSLKHAQRDDPEVEICAEDLGDYFRFVIADNGPGIAPEYKERIFCMFESLPVREQLAGTGIGLATVKKLVERRGGQVGVESEVGQGARFFFLWPRHHNLDA